MLLLVETITQATIVDVMFEFLHAHVMPPTKRKKIANERRRPKFPLSCRRLGCSRGGKIVKDCARWQFAARRTVRARLRVCQMQSVLELTPLHLFPKKARLATVRAIENPGSLASVSPRSVLASNRALATNAELCLPSARLKDLSKVFG